MSESIGYDTGHVFTEINRERNRQREEWGGDSHDDEHTIADWSLFLTKQVGQLSRWAIAMMDGGARWPVLEARGTLVKIAALAVAAIESIDRKAARP